MYFNQKLEKFLKSSTFSNHKLENLEKSAVNAYCDKNFCQKLIRVVISGICCTSKLMIGDLSRHKKLELNGKNEICYNEYSVFFEALKKLSSHFVSDESNCTQGIIEQHFGILKSDYLKGNRIARLDDFVQRYYEKLKITKKLFSDFILHNTKMIDHSETTKSRKSTSLGVSKFRKRKRRQSSYYSSPLAAKKICYVNKIDVTGTKEFDKNVVNVDIFSLKESTASNAEKISHEVWVALPNYHQIYLLDTALNFNADHKLSWLDLQTINLAPNKEIFAKIKKNFGRFSGKGWLSKYVVDSYIFALVEFVIGEKGLQKCGCLTCDDSLCIMQNKIKSTNSFGKKLMIGQSNALRSIIVIPILLQNHFMLLSFFEKTNSLVSYNSIKQNCSTFLQKIKKPFLDFFSVLNVSNKSKLINFEAQTALIQPNSSSCGVCLCMAADELCQFKRVPHKFLVEKDIVKHRKWIVMFLVSNSISCQIKLKHSANEIFKTNKIGLLNISNNCWFNATIQAIVGSFQEHHKCSIWDIKINENNFLI